MIDLEEGEPIMLTLENVIPALQDAVDSKPNGYIYINPDGEQARYIGGVACSYVDECKNEPSCIVGHALHALGVSLITLHENEGTPAHFLLDTLEEEGIAVATSDVVNLLKRVQGEQDLGTSWVDAVTYGLDRI